MNRDIAVRLLRELHWHLLLDVHRPATTDMEQVSRHAWIDALTYSVAVVAGIDPRSPHMKSHIAEAIDARPASDFTESRFADLVADRLTALSSIDQ
jgi:hypothetical protein